MTTTTANPRTALLNLLARTSFRLGNFTLSSGAKSDYYIDCRTTTLHAEGGASPASPSSIFCASTTCIPPPSADSPWAPIPSSPPSPSPAHGAHMQQPDAPLIHGFLVRKAEKTHGTGRRIEGFLEQNAPVLIVDDVCTTGASTITAIEAAREAGMKVIAAVCLVEREEAQGRAALEAALRAGLPDKQGSPFLSLYTANDVRAAHIRQLPQA